MNYVTVPPLDRTRALTAVVQVYALQQLAPHPLQLLSITIAAIHLPPCVVAGASYAAARGASARPITVWLPMRLQLLRLAAWQGLHGRLWICVTRCPLDRSSPRSWCCGIRATVPPRPAPKLHSSGLLLECNPVGDVRWLVIRDRPAAEGAGHWGSPAANFLFPFPCRGSPTTPAYVHVPNRKSLPHLPFVAQPWQVPSPPASTLKPLTSVRS